MKFLCKIIFYEKIRKSQYKSVFGDAYDKIWPETGKEFCAL